MIEVLLFAQIQEEVGRGKVTIEQNKLTVSELKEQFSNKYNIEHLLNEAMVAVNEEYAEEDSMIYAGDTVAFIPPVSGG